MKEFYFGIPVIKVRNSHLIAPAFVFFDIQLIDPFTNTVVTHDSFSNNQAAVVPAKGKLETPISTTILGTVLAFTASLDAQIYRLRVEGWVNTDGVPQAGVGTDIHLGAISMWFNARLELLSQLTSPTSLDDSVQEGFRFDLTTDVLAANIGKGVKVKMDVFRLVDSLFAKDSYTAKWGQYPNLDVKVTGPDFASGAGPTYHWSSNGPVFPLANGTFTPIPLNDATNFQLASSTMHLHLTTTAVITAKASVTSEIAYTDNYIPASQPCSGEASARVWPSAHRTGDT